MRNRHEPFLPRKAQHHHIGKNRITQKPFGHGIGVKTYKVASPHRRADSLLTQIGVQLRITVQHQITRRHFRKVQHNLGVGPVVDRGLRG